MRNWIRSLNTPLVSGLVFILVSAFIGTLSLLYSAQNKKIDEKADKDVVMMVNESVKELGRDLDKKHEHLVNRIDQMIMLLSEKNKDEKKEMSLCLGIAKE